MPAVDPAKACQPKLLQYKQLTAYSAVVGQRGRAAKAEHFKATANDAFKTGDFEGAIAGYTGAIQADPSNPVYFSNRAMAYIKVSQTCLRLSRGAGAQCEDSSEAGQCLAWLAGH